MQTAESALKIVDFCDKPAKDTALRTALPHTPGTIEQGPGSLADCVVLITASDTATTPAVVTFDDGTTETCKGENQLRALQTFQGKTALEITVTAAKEAGAAGIVILTPENDRSIENALITALFAEEIPTIPFSSKQYDETRRAFRNLEIVGTSAYEILLGRSLLEDMPDAKHLVVLSPDQVRITPGHLLALKAELARNPQADVVASWITWLRRKPLLLTDRFLASLDARAEHIAQAPTPQMPLMQLNLVDVVFGEERLSTNDTTPDAAKDLLDGAKISALQAVRLAKTLATLNGGDEETAQRRDALTATLTKSDQTLLSFANEVLAETTPTSDTFAADLRQADAWARRNKADFPIFSDRKNRDSLVFLDSAATAQRCTQVVNALNNFDLHENANVYRGAYDLSMQATFTLNDSRKLVEDFIGAKRRETIYTANTTQGANLVAQAWGTHNITKGDLILACEDDHHSNLLPWIMLAEQTGARIGYIPSDANGRIDLDAFRELLDMKPKLVCLTYVGNTLGIEHPVKDLTALAKTSGARVFIDGAQIVAHKKVDVYDLGCDFFAFSAHKMYGPLGIGGLWAHPDAYAEMAPTMGGGGAISHAALDSYYLRLGAVGYELGTPAISQAVGFGAAAHYLDLLGMDRITSHHQILTKYLVAGLSKLDFVSVVGDHSKRDGQGGLVAFNVANASPNQVGAVLGKLGVAVRSGGHCAIPLTANMGVPGTVRISMGVYTTQEDIQAALVALKACNSCFAR